MMKIHLLIVSLTVSISSFGQKNERIKIPRTRVSMVPPSGFVVSTTYSGLNKGDSSNIRIIDLAGSDFYRTVALFSREYFESKGLKVLDYQKIAFNGYPAIYIYTEAKAIMKSHQLVFGDSSLTVTIISIFPAYDSITGNQIKKSIFSATLE